MRIVIIIIIFFIVGILIFFILKGFIDVLCWVLVICLCLSRLMKYLLKIVEINNDKMIVINEWNEM